MVLGLPLLVCPCCGCQNTSVDAFSSLCLTHAQLLSFLFPCSCKKALGGDRTDLYLRRWSLKTFGAIRSILAKAPSVCFSVFLVRVHCCQEESNLNFLHRFPNFAQLVAGHSGLTFFRFRAFHVILSCFRISYVCGPSTSLKMVVVKLYWHFSC